MKTCPSHLTNECFFSCFPLQCQEQLYNDQPVPGSRSMGLIENAARQRATSGVWQRKSVLSFFLPGPARPATTFSIFPTDLEPGTGYTMINSSSLFIQIHFLHSSNMSNRQCLSYLLPLCKNESKCEIIHMISTMGSLTHSYVKCFARRLVLKQRQKETVIHELLTGAFDQCRVHYWNGLWGWRR